VAEPSRRKTKMEHVCLLRRGACWGRPHEIVAYVVLLILVSFTPDLPGHS
jgi:hypothetical protein